MHKYFLRTSLIGGTVLAGVMINILLCNQTRTKKINADDVKGLIPLPQQFDDVRSKRDQHKATRFKTIKIDLSRAKDEIEFWSHQLSEHALFLHLGLEEESLKKEAKILHEKFEDFRKNITMKNLERVLPLAQELREYKIKVLSQLMSGKWIGWIFPLFARHIILELDYLVDKLNGIPYSDADEVAFWNVINGEHAGFAAHLLDPSERSLFEKADKLAQQFEKIVESEEEMMIQISLKAAKELDQYNKQAASGIKGNKVKSVIHPALIDHVVREGQRSIKTLNSLTNKEGAIYPKEMM